MEENKDLGPEEKKTATAKKTATKKATTSAAGTKKKTATKKESTTTKKIAEEIAEPAKKVEEPKFEPAPKVEKKKKKHTLLKGILILIMIVLVLLLVHFARNYVIVDSILARQKALEELTSYSYRTEYISQNAAMDYYHKGNTIMLVRDSNNEKIIIWSNKDTKQTIFLNPKELTATIDNNEMANSSYELLPRGIIINSKQLRGAEFMYFITSEKVDGKDCYKILWITSGETCWYNKEDGTIVKLISNGQEIKYTNWEFNKLTDEDMSRPNLIGYEVKNNQQIDGNNENDNQNPEEQNNGEINTIDEISQ